MAAKHRIPLSIMVDEDLEEQLEVAASHEDVAVSDYIEDILRHSLLRRGPEPEAIHPSNDENTVRSRPWPRSVGAAANADFDARDTEAYLEAHWGSE